MLKIRCVQCDTVNYEGYMGFPICHKCHEHLIKCRYCQNFDRQFYVCGHPKRVEELGPSVDPDIGRSCPYFSSLHEVREPSPVARTTRTWTAVLIAVLAIIVVVGLVILGLQGPRSPANMEVQFPVRSAPGATVVGTISITNPSATKSLLRTVWLGDDFFGGFEITGTEPAAEQILPERGGRCYVFLPVPPGKTHVVRLYCRAKGEGDFPLEVRLFDRKRNLLADSRLTLHVSSASTAGGG